VRNLLLSDHCYELIDPTQFSIMKACAACDANDNPSAPDKKAIKIAVNLFICLKKHLEKDKV
jgi:hypothetical protein